MTTHEDPRQELLDITASLRHLRGEHLRAGADSSARRHIETRIHEVTYHLDRRLEAILDDEEDRAAWRHHAHGGPAPDRPEHRTPVAAAPRPDRPSGRRPWPR